jgi:hypothetical protein
VIAFRRPILWLAGIAVLASGFALWHAASGGPTVSSVPQPAPRQPGMVRPSTWRSRDGRLRAADMPPRLREFSRAAGAGPRLAGVPAPGGGAGAPAPAARGSFPLGAGEEPTPDPVVAARQDRLRAKVEAMRQPFPGVRLVFADCSAGNGEHCLARVESTSPAEIDRFAEAARKHPELATVRVHGRPTAMNGVIWHADMEPRFDP